MTRQEALEIAYNQYVKQGGQSVNDNGYCVYRSPDGKKCAVGALISDEDYEPVFDYVNSESRTSFIDNYEKDYKVFVELADQLGGNFLENLQYLHDAEALTNKDKVLHRLGDYGINVEFME